MVNLLMRKTADQKGFLTADFDELLTLIRDGWSTLSVHCLTLNLPIFYVLKMCTSYQILLIKKHTMNRN